MTGAMCDVRIGFIPLIDCAPLVVAREKGFAEDEGLNLILSRETSWATVRDKLSVSHFDAAHSLAPMPIAAKLGLGPLPTPMIVPMALGTGANSITISRQLFQALSLSEPLQGFDASEALKRLADVVWSRKADGHPQLKLGVVHPHSAHYYQLTYWLASGGLMPDRDITLVVVPPSLMPAALASGRIDGFCAGEPWGSVAVSEQTGVMVTTNAHIWRNSPEKVLGVRGEWAEQNPAHVACLVRAVYRAALWCDTTENQDELAELLARDHYVGQEAALIRTSLSRRLEDGGGLSHLIDGFLTFAANAATFPWTSQAMWFYSQMVRWGHVRDTEAARAMAGQTYRPDIYRAALLPLVVALPSANSKVEGGLRSETPAGSSHGRLELGPDGFFDGCVFDPDQLDAYLRQFPYLED